MSEVKVKYAADTTGIDKANKQVESGIGGLSSKLGGLAMGVAGVGAAFGALTVGGLAKGFSDLMDYAGGLSDLSEITGMTAGKLAIFSKALEDTGVSAESITKIIAGLSNKLEDPGTETAGWLQKFGLSIAEVQAMNPEERFNAIAKGIGGLTSQSQKLSASSALFGKLGASLVVMFKSPDVMRESTKYLGSLADNLTKYAADLDAVGDSIGGLRLKILGFFAGMAGPNMDLFKKLKEGIDNIDLGPLGAKFGNIANGLIEALKDGKFYEVFSVTIHKIGELLISVFEFGAQRFGRVLEDTLRGTKLGRMIGIEDAKTVDVGNGATATFKSYSTPLDDFSDIQKRNKGLFGTSDFPSGNPSKHKDLTLEEGVKLFQDTVDESLEKRAKEFKEWQDSNWQPSFNMMEPGTTNIPDWLKKSNKSNPELPMFKRENTSLSHMASIGGAKAITNNPLIDLQRESIKIQKEIARNTARSYGGTMSAVYI
jgi:hypothetical protein